MKFPSLRLTSLTAVFAVAFAWAIPSLAQQGIPAAKGPALIDVARESGHRVRVEVQLLGGAKLEEVAAKLNGNPLPRQSFEPFPYGDSLSSILFLIDTSDPARQAVIDRNLQQIGEMLKGAKPHQRFGLAIFDSDLIVKVPPGSTAAEVSAALKDIKAVGKTTELYRSVMSAITRVGVVPAARKAVFVFSDGLAEDTAYKSEDVIAAGRAAEVTVYGFGYARTPAQSVALQNIRRLAEDTGGRYFSADAQNNLAADALSEPFAAMDAGGIARFTMTPEADQDGGPLLVWVGTTAGPIELQVNLPSLPRPPEEGWRVWIRDRNNQAIAALGAVFMLGLLVLLFAALRRRRAAYLKKLADGHFDEPEAWLEFLDGDGRHVGVTGSAFRIGRNKDNDLVLANDSVSGQHAVIHKARDGGYSITDLQSINGVLVNLSLVQNASLNNGDLIELGEARFRFRAPPRELPGREPVLAVQPAEPIVAANDPETQLQAPGMDRPAAAKEEQDSVATVTSWPERR
ncbi:MAG: signal peptide protein [Alphaproteobacteria bacterium]|nr:signal peptide protein [Alphaproteobacteria bacterium]